MTKFAILKSLGVDKARDKVAKLNITMDAIRQELVRTPRATDVVTTEPPDPPRTPP